MNRTLDSWITVAEFRLECAFDNLKFSSDERAVFLQQSMAASQLVHAVALASAVKYDSTPKDARAR